MSFIQRRRELMANNEIQVERPLVLFDCAVGTTATTKDDWAMAGNINIASSNKFYTSAGLATKSYLMYKKPLTVVRRDKLRITVSRRQGSGAHNIAVTDVYNTRVSVGAEDSIALWLNDETGKRQLYGVYTLASQNGIPSELIFTPFEKDYSFTGNVVSNVNLSPDHDALTIVAQTSSSTASIYVEKIELI